MIRSWVSAAMVGAAVVAPATAAVALRTAGEQLEIPRDQLDPDDVRAGPADPVQVDRRRTGAVLLVLDFPDVRPAELPGAADRVTPEEFARRLDVLRAAGFGPGGVPMEIRFPRATAGTWEYAAPLLARRGLTATTTAARPAAAGSGTRVVNGAELAALALQGWQVADAPLAAPPSRIGPRTAVTHVVVDPEEDADALVARIVARLPAPDPAHAGPMLAENWVASAGNPIRPSAEGLRLRTSDAGGSTAHLWRGGGTVWPDPVVDLRWSTSPGAIGTLVLRDGSAEPLRVVLGRGAVRVVDVRERTLLTLPITERWAHHLTATVSGDRLELTVDGRAAGADVRRPVHGGTVAVRVTGPAGTELLLRDLRLG